VGLIEVPIRYLSVHSTSYEDNVETNIKYTETVWELDTREAALVLVDVWNKHHIRSHMERTKQIMARKIAALIRIARKVRIPVVYAPSPDIAKKYPQWVRYAGEEEIPTIPPSPIRHSDWPPMQFRKREGIYEKYARLPQERPPDYKGILPHWDAIADPIKPEPEDYVVATGGQLHRLLKDRKILHLFYAGFATNICVLYRDYGMDAMCKRGYNLVLVRDCTPGIENLYTIADFSVTKVSVMQIERKNSSTTSDDFINACKVLLN